MSDSDADQAAAHTDYRLKVTAGPAYDIATHQVVPVNGSKSLTFESEHIVISVAVRLRHFTGFPPGCPETSAYFEHSLHKHDQYSISFNFIPKQDISGNDLVFGNDFERPIRDRLPPGFNSAFKWVKWWVDPGLEGDVYADKPYLYGPALSSWNVLWIGDQATTKETVGQGESGHWNIPNAESFQQKVVEEGGEGTGLTLRQEHHIPADSAGRKKYFLTESHREDFVFEAGRQYQSDFGNQYLDFNDFSLKLPIMSINVIKYIDSKSHELRYTLKNKKTGEVYAVVLFTLLFGDELVQEEKEWAKSHPAGGDDQSAAGNAQAQPATTVNAKATANDDDEGVD